MCVKDMSSRVPFLNLRFIRNVVLKALVLLVAIDLAFAALRPTAWLARLSLYNHVFPGRLRLPYGDRPELAYNISLFSLEAMFASHEIAVSKPATEFRVVLIGDSATWGYLLKPDETLSAYLNAARLRSPDGRLVHAYNLGYPTLSLTKDLLILREAGRYHPDMVIWLVTLESFPQDKQLASPILQHNPTAVRSLIADYRLPLDANDPAFVEPSFWGESLVGQRRALADILRLQLYGVMWAATGVDQYYPDTYNPPQRDLADDQTFHGLQPPVFLPGDLAFDVLEAGNSAAGVVPVLRWAYDQYRQLFDDQCREHGWRCLDLWDLVQPGEFTNSAIHMNPAGEGQLAQNVIEALKLSYGIQP
jgi:hypothetical protein